MKTQYMLGAYWGPRQASVGDCADRLSRFMHDLRDCDPALSTWFTKGRSRQEAVRARRAAPHRPAARSLLEQGQSRRYTDGGVIEETGFHIGLWSGGEEGKEAGLSVTCGLFARPVRGYLGNCVVLNLPRDLGELCHGEHMERIVAATARAWEPEWAGVMSEHAMDTRPFSGRTPFLDWLLYVPREVATPEPPASVTRVEGLGSILRTYPMAPAAEEVDVAHLERVGAVLQPAA